MVMSASGGFTLMSTRDKSNVVQLGVLTLSDQPAWQGVPLSQVSYVFLTGWILVELRLD
jgi:hypothetical protein